MRQGYLLSPTLFNSILEKVFADTLNDHSGTVSIGVRTNTNQCDDINALAGAEELANLV